MKQCEWKWQKSTRNFKFVHENSDYNHYHSCTNLKLRDFNDIFRKRYIYIYIYIYISLYRVHNTGLNFQSRKIGIISPR